MSLANSWNALSTSYVFFGKQMGHIEAHLQPLGQAFRTVVRFRLYPIFSLFLQDRSRRLVLADDGES